MIERHSKYLDFDISALPSGMRERFLLLVVIAIAMSYWVGLSMTSFASQIVGRNVSLTSMGVIGIATLAMLTVLFYAIHPWGVKRRFGKGRMVTTPLSQECHRLMTRLGLHSVSFLITDRLLQQDGIAYGFPGRRTICFGGGMRTVYKKSPEAFRAVVAHELSHLKQGDVDIGYASRSIVQAMLVIAAVPPSSILWTYLRGYPYWHQWPFRDLEWTLRCSKAFSIEIAIVSFYLFFATADYRAVLRNREYYADSGAQRLVGSDALRKILRPSTCARKYDLLRLFRYHPPQTDRYRKLSDPLAMLRGLFTEPAIAGYYFGIMTVFINLFGLIPDRLYSGSYLDYIQRAVADPSSFAAAATLIALFILCFFVIASQSLRGGILFGLYEMRFPAFFGRSVAAAVAFSFGLSVGVYVNPIYFEQTLLTDHPIVSQLDWEVVLFLFGGMVLTSLMFGAYIRYLFPISVAAPLSGTARLFLLVTWVWCAIYNCEAVGVMVISADWLWFQRWLLFVMWLIIMLLPLSAMSVGAVVRRHHLRRLSRAEAVNG